MCGGGEVDTRSHENLFVRSGASWLSQPCVDDSHDGDRASFRNVNFENKSKSYTLNVVGQISFWFLLVTTLTALQEAQIELQSFSITAQRIETGNMSAAVSPIPEPQNRLVR
jgi:hypothetical protein